jgi:HlyD family secretion protein
MKETLTRELALTPTQRERLDAILGESRQAFTAMRAQGLDEKARDAQRRRIRTETREKVREMLTPEQQKKYDGLVATQDGGGSGGTAAPAGSPARIFVLGPDGKPKAVSIVVGLTDGSYGELLQGDIQVGQDVLVGQAGAQPQRAGGGGPRLRF